MQTGAHNSRNEMSRSCALTPLQAERTRIAANNNFRRETRRGNISLRRLVGHIAILDALDDMQSEQLSSPLPSYSETVPETRSTSQPNICFESETSLPNSDDTPGLETDEQINDEWWDDDSGAIDDECDADHALLRVYSHPPTHAQKTQHGEWGYKRSNTFDPFDMTEALCEMMGKFRSELLVIERVEEVTNIDDH